MKSLTLLETVVVCGAGVALDMENTLDSAGNRLDAVADDLANDLDLSSDSSVFTVRNGLIAAAVAAVLVAGGFAIRWYRARGEA